MVPFYNFKKGKRTEAIKGKLNVTVLNPQDIAKSMHPEGDDKPT